MNWLICTIGLLLHFSMKWAEYRQDVAKVGLIGYISEVPAQSAVALLATLGVMLVAQEMMWMNTLTAFSAGYMGSSMAENYANKFIKD